jgi:hypothetical protein
VDLSRSQIIWLTVGIASLILISILAFANFQSIYSSQKDFVVGGLLSVVGFSFGRAFSRTQEQRAIQLITDAPSEHVERVLRQEIEARLHSDGAFEQLSVLERNVDAAVNRLSEYYDSQARRLEFYRHAPLLRVALDDLDKASGGVAELRAILAGADGRVGTAIHPSMRLQLMRVRRDLGEAVGRRDQAYEWLVDRLGADASETWDLFAVMTADMLKGDRMLEVLWSRHIVYPVDEYVHSVGNYVNVALLRAEEFKQALSRHDIEAPTIFGVMVTDLTNATAGLTELERKPAVQ